MVKFDSNGVGHGYSRCNDILVLDLSDMRAHKVHNVTNEVRGDGI